MYIGSNGFDQFFSCFKVENIIFFKTAVVLEASKAEALDLCQRRQY